MKTCSKSRAAGGKEKSQGDVDEFGQHAPNPLHQLMGCLALCGLFLVLGSAPQLVPHVMLIFQVIALPWRIVRFTRRGWVFFLVDYCYLANLAVACFFLALPVLARMDGSSSSSDSMACFDTICSDAAAHTSSATEGTTNCGCGWGSSGSSSRGGAALLPGLAASVYVLSEGPLAAALMAWQCAWVLDSADHTVSVMIHLLPGLAMFAYHYYWPCITMAAPLGLSTCSGLRSSGSSGPSCSGSRGTTPSSSLDHTCGHSMSCTRQYMAVHGDSSSTVSHASHTLGSVLHATWRQLTHPPCETSTVPAAGACAWGAVAAGTLMDPLIQHPTEKQMTADPAMGLTAASQSDTVACCAAASCAAAVTYGSDHSSWGDMGTWQGQVLWLAMVPLAFYLAWQLLYFLVVQVAFRPLIRARRLDTSFNALARRAARAGGWLNGFVRRGSVARRITMYGLLQLAFTFLSGALAVATYHSFPLALAWQVTKFVGPLWFGACYQSQSRPRAASTRGQQAAAAVKSTKAGGASSRTEAIACACGTRGTKSNGIKLAGATADAAAACGANTGEADRVRTRLPQEGRAGSDAAKGSGGAVVAGQNQGGKATAAAAGFNETSKQPLQHACQQPLPSKQQSRQSSMQFSNQPSQQCQAAVVHITAVSGTAAGMHRPKQQAAA